MNKRASSWNFAGASRTCARPSTLLFIVPRRAATLLAFLFCFGSTGVVRAQWITQSFQLQPGWNAVYLHVDASHRTLSELIDTDSSNPIQEVWLWRDELPTAQFFSGPQAPTVTGSQWYNWTRSLGPSSPLQRLIPNSAFLVRVSNNVSSYTWNLKGKPVPPRYRWTSTGLNFIGFPTLPANPPSFESFLSLAPEIQQFARVFRYPGGELGTGNPVQVMGLRTASVRRGEAFWIRAGTLFNRYFGPFELSLQDSGGVVFGDARARYRVRIRNIVSQPVTVKLQMISSETPPSGQAAIVAVPPVLVRGELDPATLGHAHTALADGPQEWTLAPKDQVGSEVEVVLGLNRSTMNGNPSDLFAGVLRFTDSFNFSQVDIPVSAVVAAKGGLWIGQASVTQVAHFLTTYQRDSQGRPVTGSDGRHVVTDVNTSMGGVVRSFPLRLILHINEGDQKTYLMQRVFYGTGNQDNSFVTRWYINPVVSWSEAALKRDEIFNAFRISAAHLPFTPTNQIWLCEGELKRDSTLKATVVLDYDDHASNPFLHTYHPDHDNLSAAFEAEQPQGFESYRVERQIFLRVTPPLLNNFANLTSGSNALLGEYEEVIKLTGKPGEVRQFNVRGDFTLNRITDIPFLTPPQLPQ